MRATIRRFALIIMIMLCGAVLFAQYPEVTIREIQTVPPGQDSSCYAGDTVHVGGIVTAGNYLFYAGHGQAFYIGMLEGGPFSGVLVGY